ncbi:hypothetical protein ACWD04_29240 [Streptomyces sp. NPDC002911]
MYLYGTPADDPLDLAPLAGLENLTVHIGFGTRTTGTELFPPERLLPDT